MKPADVIVSAIAIAIALMMLTVTAYTVGKGDATAVMVSDVQAATADADTAYADGVSQSDADWIALLVSCQEDETVNLDTRQCESLDNMDYVGGKGWRSR